MRAPIEASRLRLPCLALLAAVAALGGCGDEDDAWLSIDSPSDGDCWAVWSSKDICWTSRHVSHVRIEFSRNGGQDWQDVAASVPASAGVYEWTVLGVGPPPLPQRDCVPRVSDASDGGPSATVGIAIWGGAWRVDAGAAPDGDGLSWDQALQHPRDAVDLAVAGDRASQPVQEVALRGADT